MLELFSLACCEGISFRELTVEMLMIRLLKSLKLVILFFLPFNLLAQVKVLDSLTQLPIVGVTIAIDQRNASQITDEQGGFDLKMLNLNSDQSITFTSIGYQKKVLTAKNLLETTIVYLSPVTYALNEVNIKARKYRKHLVGGGMSLLHGSNSYGGYAYEEARYFPNEYNEGSKIVAVQYFVIKKQSFQKVTNVDLSNAFGVGIYEANADGSPGAPLLKDALVVMAKEHAKWFEVNLEQYDLPMPKYGFVVSFMVFPAAFYKAKDTKVNHTNFVAPVLAIKTYLRKSPDSWRKGLYPKSVWKRDTFSHFGIRAMVAEAK